MQGKIRKSLITRISFIIFCVLLSTVSVAGEYKSLEQSQLTNFMTKDALLVDVRTLEEYEEGHIPGAINIPLALIEEDTSMFKSKKQTLILYCRSGRRAGIALDVLAEKGYENIYHLSGDMNAWKEANLPIEKTEK